jgi:hypothetical protein
MADPEKSDQEFGRRLAAARGYSRVRSAQDWAKEVMEGIDRGTLRRYELGEIDPQKRPWAIERCMEATDLPKEFFTIDFNRLPEMVAAWRQVQQQADEDFVGAQERDEAETLPPGPNGSQSEEPGPGAANR